MGSQQPTHLWHPPFEVTAGPRAVALYELCGRVLDPWQKLALDVAMAMNPDRTWLCFEFALIVSRQNGKGEVLIALELAWLFLFHEPLIIHSAHLFETAREHFEKISAIVRNTPAFSKRILTIKEGKGSEEIEITPRHTARDRRTLNCSPVCRLCRPASLKFMSRKGGAGRGFTAGKLVFDECMYLDADMMAAGLPTMATRAGEAQVIYAGSAGFKTSTQQALVRKRGMAMDDPELGFMAWEIDPPVYDERGRLISGDDPASPHTHAKVNPTYGIRINAKTVEREARTMGGWLAPTFWTERLGYGDYPADGDGWLVISKDDYAGSIDSTSMIDMTRPVCLGIDTENDVTTIAIAGWRASDRGRPKAARHVEVVARHRGTTWAVEKLLGQGEHDIYGELNLWRRLRKPVVAILRNGLAAEIGERLASDTRGAKAVQVERPTETEYCAACAKYVESVRRHDLVHIGQTSIEVALGGAEQRINTEGGWRWARDVATEQAPIVAATIADWCLLKFGQSRSGGVF